MTFPKLDIIIVNWNSGLQLYDCLNSVEKADKSALRLNRVVVVDNDSTDYSLGNIESLNLPLEVIRNNQNRGFAVACNQGAKNSIADYLLFLNPDTRLEPDALEKSIGWMEKVENQKIGITGIQLLNESGDVQRSCARFPVCWHFINGIFGLNYIFPKLCLSYHMLDWDHTGSRQVDHVIGAFFLVRNSLFERLNGFDERYFVYLEDLDFSYRSNYLGYRSYYLSNVKSYHKGGGTSEQVKAFRLFQSLRSRILYGYKHFSFYQAVILFLLSILIEPVIRIIWSIIRGSFAEIPETWSAYRMLYSAIPDMLNKIK
jgi:N-acetylglucosaminyl-diphospho-decaprenol L-rhamnosyltransferase